jgi:uncharacterized protein YcbK (DUF882 family)
VKPPWAIALLALSSVASASISAPTASVATAATSRGERAAQAAAKREAPPAASGLATKKGGGDDPGDAPPLLATLVQTHTDERVLLDRDAPDQARFDRLLADRVTGESHALDPRLLGLLRTLAARHAGARIELVSGYRSPKLNEILRKKGHHVASHSQHSLGHACDFRIVPPGATRGIAPRDLEKEIRALGWAGGTGVYTGATDWFVHADVGPKRNWLN